jgi:hypothetical protein
MWVMRVSSNGRGLFYRFDADSINLPDEGLAVPMSCRRLGQLLRDDY